MFIDNRADTVGEIDARTSSADQLAGTVLAETVTRTPLIAFAARDAARELARSELSPDAGNWLLEDLAHVGWGTGPGGGYQVSTSLSTLNALPST